MAALKILTRIAGAIAGVAIVLYLVVCALNGRDQAPSATERWLSSHFAST